MISWPLSSVLYSHSSSFATFSFCAVWVGPAKNVVHNTTREQTGEMTSDSGSHESLLGYLYDLESGSFDSPRQFRSSGNEKDDKIHNTSKRGHTVMTVIESLIWYLYDLLSGGLSDMWFLDPPSNSLRRTMKPRHWEVRNTERRRTEEPPASPPIKCTPTRGSMYSISPRDHSVDQLYIPQDIKKLYSTTRSILDISRDENEKAVTPVTPNKRGMKNSKCVSRRQKQALCLWDMYKNRCLVGVLEIEIVWSIQRCGCSRPI